MHRYEKVKNHLSKGYTFEGDEQTNSGGVTDWSPNNFRRLIIGYNRVIVGYYTTAGKFSKKTEIIRLDNEAQKEIQDYVTLAQSGKKFNYIPIAKILTGLRVMSCIEEIYFITDGYPEEFLNEEMQALNSIIQKSKFEHLRAIGYLQVSYEQTEEVLRGVKLKQHNLLIESHEFNSITTVVSDFPKSKEVKEHTGLRPKIYAFDQNTLMPVFSSIYATRKGIDEKKNLARYDQEKVAENLKKLASLQVEYEKPFNVLYSKIEEIIQGLDDIYFHLSFVYQAQWGYRGRRDLVLKDLMKELKQHSKYVEFERMDITTLCSNKGNAQSDTLTKVGLFLSELFPNQQGKKGLSDNYEQDMKLIKTLLVYTLKFALYKTHELYTAFVTDNTLQYAVDYHNDLKTPLRPVHHNRKIAEFCNKRLTYGYYTDAYEKIGHIRNEDLSLDELYRDCVDIITSLKTYSYVDRKR